MIIGKDGYAFNNHLFLTTEHCHLRKVYVEFTHFTFKVINHVLTIEPIDDGYYPEIIKYIGELLYMCLCDYDTIIIRKNDAIMKTVIELVTKNDTFMKSVKDFGFTVTLNVDTVTFNRQNQ